MATLEQFVVAKSENGQKNGRPYERKKMHVSGGRLWNALLTRDQVHAQGDATHCESAAD